MVVFWRIRRAAGGGFDAVVFANSARTMWSGSWHATRLQALEWVDSTAEGLGALESFAIAEGSPIELAYGDLGDLGALPEPDPDEARDPCRTDEGLENGGRR